MLTQSELWRSIEKSSKNFEPEKNSKIRFPKIFNFSKFRKCQIFIFPKSPMSTPTMFPWPLWPHKRLRNDFPRRGRRSRPTRPEQARSTTYTERRGQRRIQNEQNCENPELHPPPHTQRHPHRVRLRVRGATPAWCASNSHRRIVPETFLRPQGPWKHRGGAH